MVAPHRRFVVATTDGMVSIKLYLQRSQAQKVLTQLKEHPDAWTRVDTILEYSRSQQTKFFALLILEDVIKFKWRALPREQCEGIKNYVVNLAIKLSSDEATLHRERVFLTKLNYALVQVLFIAHPGTSYLGFMLTTCPRRSSSKSGQHTGQALCLT